MVYYKLGDVLNLKLILPIGSPPVVESDYSIQFISNGSQSFFVPDDNVSFTAVSSYTPVAHASSGGIFSQITSVYFAYISATQSTTGLLSCAFLIDDKFNDGTCKAVLLKKISSQQNSFSVPIAYVKFYVQKTNDNVVLDLISI